MSFNFSRTSTAAAVSAALLASLAVSPVSAMSLSNNGLGDVGISAYYSVRQNYQTYISLVNTSDTYVVAVKLRFHEAANSRDARDFNIFLSPNDVWVGLVGLNADGKTPYIQTSDTSCTAPNKFPAGTANTAANRARGFVVIGKASTGADIKQMDFTAADYTGANQDTTASPLPYPSAQNIVRTQEGYIEVIEMGVALPRSTINPAASTLAAGAVHVNGAAPTGCETIIGVYNGSLPVTVTGSTASAASGLTLECNLDTTAAIGDLVFEDVAFQAEFCEPLNVLKVASNMVRANTGQNFGVPVTTVADFVSPGTDLAANFTESQLAPDPADVMAQPSSPFPNLNSGSPSLSVQTPSDGALLALGLFIRPVDAVGSLLTATSVINEYRAVASGAPQTGWVVTFPTKAFYVDNGANDPVGSNFGGKQGLGVLDPFEEEFDFVTGGSCVTVALEYYNREEKRTIGSVPPSPFVPGQSAICHETQTLNFSKAGVTLGSQFNSAFALEPGYTQGWARLSFPLAGSISSLTGATYSGLPTTGFALTSITNGSVSTAGYVSPHAYDRPIAVPAP